MVPPARFIHDMDTNSRNPKQPLIWILLDDRAGNRSQCQGVADALGLDFQVKEVRYSALARLPNALLGASFLGLSMESRLGFQAPWPDLVIAAGRRTAPIARAIKARSPGKTALVQIMYPGNAGVGDFDLIAIPSHDEVVAGGNILTVLGAPHGITTGVLSKAAMEWQDKVATFPSPRIALLVGGSTRRRTFTPQMAAELGGMANQMAKSSNGSLMISTSRRTGKAAEDSLFAEISVPHQAFRWGQEGPNPYRGYLEMADTIIVTGDSVSMCSEVCATEAPVYIYAPSALITPKHGRLHDLLYDGGYARPLNGEWSVWRHDALNSADQIADAIRQRLLSVEAD